LRYSSKTVENKYTNHMDVKKVHDFFYNEYIEKLEGINKYIYTNVKPYLQKQNRTSFSMHSFFKVLVFFWDESFSWNYVL